MGWNGMEWDGMGWNRRCKILDSQSSKKISKMIILPCLPKRGFLTRGDEGQMGVQLALKSSRNSGECQQPPSKAVLKFRSMFEAGKEGCLVLLPVSV